MTLCGTIAVQQNGVNIIASHKCFQDLLDIAHQIYNLQKIKKELSFANRKENESAMITFDLDICFLSEIILSSIVLMDIIFQCLPLNLVFIGKQQLYHRVSLLLAKVSFENKYWHLYSIHWLKFPHYLDLILDKNWLEHESNEVGLTEIILLMARSGLSLVNKKHCIPKRFRLD
jgi:hypothetical protein